MTQFFTLIFIVSLSLFANAISPDELPPETVCENRIDERKKQIVDGTAPEHVQRYMANKTTIELIELKNRFMRRCVSVVERIRAEAREEVANACNQAKEDFINQCSKPRRALANMAMNLATEINARNEEIESLPEEERPGPESASEEIKAFAERIQLIMEENHESVMGGGAASIDIGNDYPAGTVFPGCGSLREEIADRCKNATIAYIEPEEVGTEEGEAAEVSLADTGAGPQADAVVEVPQSRDALLVISEHENRASSSQRHSYGNSQTAFNEFIALVSRKNERHESSCEFANCGDEEGPPTDEIPRPQPRPEHIGEGNPSPAPSPEDIPSLDGQGYGGPLSEDPQNPEGVVAGGPSGVQNKTGTGELGTGGSSNWGNALGSLGNGVSGRYPYQINQQSISSKTNSAINTASNNFRGTNGGPNLNLDSFNSGQTYRNPQASNQGQASQGSEASKLSGGAGYHAYSNTNSNSNATGGKGSHLLGMNDSDNKAQPNAKNKKISRKYKNGNKQLYSSKNRSSGSGAAFFGKDKNSYDQNTLTGQGEANKKGSQFDPSKYEPSLDLQQKALARAAGRDPATYRGKAWPKDIYRSKGKEDPHVFNYMRSRYIRVFSGNTK